MNNETKPNIKEESLAIIFDEWLKRSKENPEEFTIDENNESYGLECAKYFTQLQKELFEKGKTKILPFELVEIDVIKWFMWLAMEMRANDFSASSVLSIDIEAWMEYYRENLTPTQALQTDCAEGV